MNTKPTLLYDGDCGFCWRMVVRSKKITGAAVDYLPYQTALEKFPKVTKSQCAAAAQLIMPDGTVFSAAHAVFKTLSLSGGWPKPLWLYKNSVLFRTLSEFSYRLVAKHRPLFSRLFGSAQCKR